MDQYSILKGERKNIRLNLILFCSILAPWYQTYDYACSIMHYAADTWVGQIKQLDLIKNTHGFKHHE